ncbi:dicarboxylate/amino acid:cation symporter [Bacillus sp. FJAT-52991]|uniref:Dicarboxylate/amino acid:cation symporter n=1 Tax=Bacillus kandeliae TaxID=3129297 RepID=A0ABZ2N844_9BACI
MLKLWNWYRQKSFMVKITSGFIFGLICGLLFGPSNQVVAPLGTLFLNLLKMIVVPLILLTLIISVNHSNPKDLGRIGGKIFPYYILTTAVAVVTGICIAKLMVPGKGLSLPTSSNFEVPEKTSLVDSLTNMVPSNIFQAFANGDILAVVFVAVIVGFAISFMRHSHEVKMQEMGDLLLKISEAGSEVTFRILNGILQYAPIGVFGITASTIGNQGMDTLLALSDFVITSYVGVLFQMLVIFPIILKAFKVPVIPFIKNTKEAIMTAFVTCSSLGTLPVTLKAAEKAGISDRVANFTLPIGATVNMNGSAIRFGVGVIFASEIAGIDLSLSALFGVVIAGTLAAIGTAGVPGAGLIGMSIVFTQAGLPIEIIGLTAGINVIVDMIFTCCNVTGDIVGAKIVDQSEKKHADYYAEESNSAISQ